MACIVYVTTNLVNGKKYIGKHNGKRPNYFGSGLAIKSALKKYGKASFSKEIIAEVGTDQEAFLLEEKLSREWNVVADPNWYNMKVGGKGFCSGADHPMWGTKATNEHKRNTAVALCSYYSSMRTPEGREKNRLAQKQSLRHRESRDRLRGIAQGPCPAKRIPKSLETKEKMRQARLLYWKNKKATS